MDTSKSENAGDWDPNVGICFKRDRHETTFSNTEDVYC